AASGPAPGGAACGADGAGSHAPPPPGRPESAACSGPGPALMTVRCPPRIASTATTAPVATTAAPTRTARRRLRTAIAGSVEPVPDADRGVDIEVRAVRPVVEEDVEHRDDLHEEVQRNVVEVK